MSRDVHSHSRAPGKLVLLGEYAVIEGAPAWVAAVDRYVDVRAAFHTKPALTVFAPGARKIPVFEIDHGLESPEPGWELALAAMHAMGAPAALEIDSRSFFLPDAEGKLLKAGFGSSAAVVAAVLALAPGHDGNQDVLFGRARALHHRVQGNVGSGIDIAAAVYGGAISYRLDAAARPHLSKAPVPDGLTIGTVWMGASASTPAMLRQVEAWKQAAPAAHETLFRGMTECSTAGIDAVKSGDVDAVIESAREYGHRMSQLGRAAGVPIVTGAMEDLAGRLAGRAAVKPSGAGGGDVALVFVPASRENEAREAVEAAGLTWLNLAFGAPGAAPVAPVTNS